MMAGCQSEKSTLTSEQKAPVQPSMPVITKSNELSFEVTTEVRTNGCTLVLRRYTNKRPSMQGYWTQDAFADTRLLFRIQHSTSPKEQALMFNLMKDVVVMPIDQNLNGRYDMFLVLSVKRNELIDVLVVTEDGWLRHANEDEFQTRRKIAEKGKRGEALFLETLDKVRNKQVQ
jgi:hypothetical protein